MAKPKTIMIDDVEYVRKSDVARAKLAVRDGMPYVIVRGDRSGVFAGFLESREGREVALLDCRRIWYWSGAASISQLSKDGTSKPADCKFPAPVDNILILDAVEVITCTNTAMTSIQGVSIWQK